MIRLAVPTRRTQSAVAAVLWEAYPPAALLAAAALMASGCTMPIDLAYGDEPPAPRHDEVRYGDEAVLASAELDAAPPVAYPTDLPLAGHAAARAVVLHGKDRVDLINLGKIAWPAGGRVWVNGRWSFALPAAEPGVFVKLGFEQLVDVDGEAFPTDNRDTLVERVEIEMLGELANVRYALGY